VAVALRSNSNLVFQCAFHVVWCPKYRRRVIGGRMEERLKQVIREVVEEKGAWLVELETMPDHVHLLLEVDPQYGIHKLVKAIKGRTSHVLQQTLMDLDRACRDHGTFKIRWRSSRRWSPSFRFPPGNRSRWNAWGVSGVGRSYPSSGGCGCAGPGRWAVRCGRRPYPATAGTGSCRFSLRTGPPRPNGTWWRTRRWASTGALPLRWLPATVTCWTASSAPLARLRTARGTVAEPGRNVKQKAGLNRAILDKGWHKLQLAVENVARYAGTTIVKVPAAYTSQMCSACHSVSPNNRESQAVFRCLTCGHTEHADVNAAKNILAAGQAVTACGDLATRRSVKQEPARPQGPAHQPAPALVGIPGFSQGEEVNSVPRCGSPHATDL
jgi:REP element-mobilizing transposase RayT